MSTRAGAALVVLAVLGAAAAGYALRADRDGSESFFTMNARAAAALDELLPDDAVVAMGDRAGVVGWFLDRPVVQLEGIVNSAEYLDALEQGSDAVHEFLADAGVDYYVRSFHNPELEVDPLWSDGEECVWRNDPSFGTGPYAWFLLCRDDLVLELGAGTEEVVVAFDYPPDPARVAQYSDELEEARRAVG